MVDRLHQPMGEKPRHRRFRRLEVPETLRQFLGRSLLQRVEQGRVEIALEHRRVDLAFPTDRQRFAD
jgi:hypothetical protein